MKDLSLSTNIIERDGRNSGFDDELWNIIAENREFVRLGDGIGKKKGHGCKKTKPSQPERKAYKN